ncbi:hypothetical protein Tco_0400350 [Tanacetum coccineum]
MPTKIELTLKQSQQGVSDDVLVSIVEGLSIKRYVMDKGEKKESLPTHLAETGAIHRSIRITDDCIGLDDDVAASFQRSRIHKPHAHSQAFKVKKECNKYEHVGQEHKMIENVKSR